MCAEIQPRMFIPVYLIMTKSGKKYLTVGTGLNKCGHDQIVSDEDLED